MVSDLLTDACYTGPEPGPPIVAMLIACPNCDTSYQVGAASIGAGGRSVRCVRCQRLWLVTEPAGRTPLPSPDTPEAIPDDPGINAAATAAVDDQAEAATRAEPSQDMATAPAEEPPAADPSAAWPETAPEPSAVSPHDDEATAAETPLLSNIRIPVFDAPPLRTMATDPVPPPVGAPPITAHHIEARARRRMPSRPQRPREPSSMPLPLIILVLAAAVVALIGWRKPIVREVPQLASLYEAIGLPVNLRGVVFEGVRVSAGMHDSVPVLMVEGTIASVAGTPVEVPQLRFAMRNDAGAEVYTWTMTPGELILAPRANLPFRSRLAAPPAEGRDVELRFLDRRDAVAAAR